MSVAKVHPYLAIEGTPGPLKAEVVVQVGIGQVAAFHGEVVSPILQAIGQRQVVRELVGHNVVAAAAYYLGVVGEGVRPLIVVGQRQQVAPPAQVVPIEVGVKVGKAVGHVGHARTVAQVFHRRAGTAYLVAFIVAHIHLGIIAAQAEPAPQAVAGREVVALGQHVAVIDVGGVFLTAAQVLHVSLYVVVRIAVDQSALQIEGMAPQRLGIAEAQVQVVAAFGAEADLAALQVFVAKHLFNGGQAVGTLIG